ncbi:rhamnosyl transferase [Morganella morganii]|nr:rhamnosyl transferase [Morganella morganii]
MNVVLFTVNYHNDPLLLKCLKTIKNYALQVHDLTLSIHILDNSEKNNQEIRELKNKLGQYSLDITLYADGKNNGYFGGLPLCQSISNNQTDVVIYCNSDLYFDINFFSNLNEQYNYNFCGNAMLAPSIITLETKVDQNPKYMTRLTKKKLAILNIIYKNIITFTVHDVLSKIKEKLVNKKENRIPPGTHMYAPHGAVFIFTDIKFLKSLPKFECFLFGEEIFIAEEARIKNKTISYEPALVINDERHASISLIGKEKNRQFHADSIKYIMNQYYQK